MVTVVVLDYGSGNVRSAVRALERAGAEVTLTADRDAAMAADGLVVPGVGAYAACMAGLRAVDAEAILRRRLELGAPVLGICVGMQVLFEAGVEHGIETAGLGVLAGRVEPLIAPVVPHMGWNTVTPVAGSQMFAGVEDQRFYFVHSYAVHPTEARQPATPGFGLTTAEHGEQFVAAVEFGTVWATQFHPEKSGDAGTRLLRNWLALLSPTTTDRANPPGPGAETIARSSELPATPGDRANPSGPGAETIARSAELSPTTPDRANPPGRGAETIARSRVEGASL